MIAKGRKSIDINPEEVDQYSLLTPYFGVSKLPFLMKSPFREDKHPSFALYSKEKNVVLYYDFVTKESGNLLQLLQRLWGCSLRDVLRRISKDPAVQIVIQRGGKRKLISKGIQLECKVREWEDYDIEYWKQFGITLPWLKFADVYPISHTIVTKNGYTFAYKADKYAYAYAEFKEGKTTLKIYQPFSKTIKWSSTHDKSVISLWTKVPDNQDVCICSSLKDALCLWINLGIPSIAIQAEGFPISETALRVLRDHHPHIFICLDNDETGLKDAEALSEKTGFKNVVIPPFEGGKDISDYYKIYHTLQPLKHLFYDT